MEEWIDIEGYEGLYQVSNYGNVKSFNYRRTGKENRNGFYITNVSACCNGKRKTHKGYRWSYNPQ